MCSSGPTMDHSDSDSEIAQKKSSSEQSKHIPSKASN
jgi:hypothetical protein